MKTYQHYINGDWVEPADGDYLDTANPATAKTWAKVPAGNAADVDAAVTAAQAAFDGGWGESNPAVRAKLLFKLVDCIERDLEHLAEIEVRDNGKLLSDVRAQVKYMGEWFRYYGGLADKIEGAVIPTDRDTMHNFTRYEPLGVVGLITPWNSPLILLAWKLAPALAAGNAVVIKPSEFTSASTLEFMKTLAAAGFPPGVVNTVCGDGVGVGEPLVTHPQVAKIAFTGSDATGQKIYQAAAAQIKPVTLELGGKSPNIVFDDANLEAAVMGAITGIFGATGQTCVAGSRMLVQKSVHDQFVARLVEISKNARIGNPLQSGVHIGPVTTEAQYQKILNYLALAKQEGATCVLGGGAHADPDGGWYIQPTIYTEVRNQMRIAQEEIFGPVLAIIPFDDEADAIAIANQIPFGLAAGVWTENIGRALRMSKQLRAGTVWVNTYRAITYNSPFGGYKRSGIGRENGIDAIKHYTQVKSVWIAEQPSTANPLS